MNSRYRKVFSIAFILFFLLIGRACALELSDIFSLIDWNCLDPMILGICFSPAGGYGVIVMYWEPALLIETVKRPGDTVIGSIGSSILDITKDAAGNIVSQVLPLNIPLSSGSSSSKISETNMQFNEVHVYELPFRDEIMSSIDIQCPDKLPAGSFVKYLSELDSLEWRIGLLELLNPKSVASIAVGQACGLAGSFMDDLCMGSWGATYPRRGFFTHQSEVVGSAAATIRAVSIASPLSIGHVVLESIGFMPSFEADKLELIYPVVSGPIPIGQNPVLWESGKLSPNGKYLWIYWRRRICCIT